jgi:hypothetical protein
MESETQNLYQQRLNRYVTAMYNGKPDRIPLRIFAEEFAAKYCGYTNYDVAVNHELQFDINRRFAVETGIDAIQTNSVVNWFGMQKAIGWDGITFPGIGLSVDDVNQWSEPTTDEQAFLKASEYDEFIDDPTAFLVTKWFARFTAISIRQAVRSRSNTTCVLHQCLMAYNYFFNHLGAKTTELIQAGVVLAVSSVLEGSLDIMGDSYVVMSICAMTCMSGEIKSSKPVSALMPHLLNLVLGGADPSGNLPSIIWMHRGAVPFIS